MKYGEMMKSLLVGITLSWLVMSPFQLAYAGAADGAGGNINDEKVSVYNAQHRIKKLSAIDGKLKYVLISLDAFLEEWSGYDVKGKDLKKYLSKDGKSVIDYLTRITWKINTDGYCKGTDVTGKLGDQDASVIDQKNLIVCISAFSLSKKFTSTNFDKFTLALMAHEIVHLMGNEENEIEAKAIASIVADNYNEGVESRYSQKVSMEYGLSASIENIKYLKETTLVDPKKIDKSEVALVTGIIAETICGKNDNLMDRAYDMQSSFKLDEIRAFNKMCLQAQLLKHFVYSEKLIEEHFSHLDKSKNRVTLGEVYPASGEPDTRLFWIAHPGDVETLNKILNILESEAKRFIKILN